MTDNPVQVFVATFDNETEAKESLEDFKVMEKQGARSRAGSSG
jgi:hypothetical protein